MASDVQEMLKAHFQSIRIPQSGDKVFKDECALCFDTPVNNKFYLFPLFRDMTYLI